METLRFEGALNGKDVVYRNWRADRVETKGSWIASPSGGEIGIESASVSTSETERGLNDVAPGRSFQNRRGEMAYRFG